MHDPIYAPIGIGRRRIIYRRRTRKKPAVQAVVLEASIDSVVEEPYLSIPRLHPGLAETIPVAIRRWRRTPWRHETRDEIAFLLRLPGQAYNAVIDSQGLIKRL